MELEKETRREERLKGKGSEVGLFQVSCLVGNVSEAVNPSEGDNDFDHLTLTLSVMKVYLPRAIPVQAEEPKELDNVDTFPKSYDDSHGFLWRSFC